MDDNTFSRVAKIVWYKKPIFWAVPTCFVLGAAVIIGGGYYPVAIVNNHIVSARRFHLSYLSSSSYYTNVLSFVSEKPASETLKENELRATTLDKLIADELVREEVAQKAGRGFDYLLKDKMNALSAETDIEKTAASLYGISWEDFKKEVLMSQALREILVGQLFLKGEKPDEWSREARRRARVLIFKNGLRWDGEKVVVKN